MRRLSFATLLVALLLVQAPARAEEVPVHTGFVTDQVGLLTADSRAALESELRAYRDVTTIEVGVLIVPTLGGRNLSEYAQTLWSSWKIGKKGEDNGVLLLVVPPPEKKAWIATGYGIQPYLTDVECKRIVEDAMKPLNFQGKRSEAVTAGVHAIIAKLGQTPWAQRTPPVSASSGGSDGIPWFWIIFWIVVIVFILWLLTRRGGGYNSSGGYSSYDSGGGGGGSSSDFGGGDSGGGGGGGDSG